VSNAFSSTKNRVHFYGYSLKSHPTWLNSDYYLYCYILVAFSIYCFILDFKQRFKNKDR